MSRRDGAAFRRAQNRVERNLARWSWRCYVLEEDAASTPTLQKSSKLDLSELIIETGPLRTRSRPQVGDVGVLEREKGVGVQEMLGRIRVRSRQRSRGGSRERRRGASRSPSAGPRL